MSKRRKYSPEFKQEAVALTHQPGVSCRQVALEIGINPNLLNGRKREADAVSEEAFGVSGTLRDEGVARLKGDLASLNRIAKLMLAM